MEKRRTVFNLESNKMRARIPTPKESKHSHYKEIGNKHIPKPYKVRNFYIEPEVVQHNTADDCWVSFFNQVFDLTLLIQDNHANPLCDPIVLAAGTDITHWFDP